MITAHLPSGYVFARYLPWQSGGVMAAALGGAVLPDFDMLFFYFVDGRQIHHHRYWVHIPFFWAVVAACTLPLLAWLEKLRLGAAFFGAILLHLCLDSLTGGILWGAPFDDHLYTLITVPAAYDHWVLSFVLHWSFWAEIGIWVWAALLWLKRNKQ